MSAPAARVSAARATSDRMTFPSTVNMEQMFEIVRTCDGRRRMWENIFETNFAPTPGGVLAFFGGIQPLTDFSVTYDLTMRCIRERESGKPLYKHFLHLWPTSLGGRDIPAEFRAVVEKEAQENRAADESVTQYMASVQFIPVKTCDGDALISVLENTTTSSSIYIHRAEIYRFSGVRFAPRASSRSIHGLPLSMSVAEDISSEHAQRLVQGALRVAASKKSTIVLSFESSGFADESLPEALKDEKEFAVVNIGMTEAQSRLRTAFRECLDNVATMTVVDVAEHLASAGESKLNTALCTAAVLSAKGVSGLAWQTVVPFFDEILASDMCSRILSAAQFAFAAGKEDVAAILLKRAAELDPHELELLLTLHTLTEQVQGRSNAQGLLERLHARFPNDPTTKVKRLLFYLSNRDFAVAHDLAVGLSDDYLVALCDALSADSLPIKEFFESARKMGKEDRARHDLALEACRRGRYGAAWRFLRGCQPSKEIVRIQCQILTQRLLRRGNVTDSSVDDLAKIMSYVARHPGQLASRFALERMIEDDLEYYSAVSLLAVLMDREVSRLHEIAMQSPATNECEWIKDASLQDEPDDQSFETLMEVIKALPRNSATFPGEGEFPAALQDKATPKMLFDWIYMLQHDESWAADENHQTRMLLLHAIIMLAAYLKDPTSDAFAIRYLVMMQWMAGRPQESRDLAETALMVLPASQSDFREWRLAFGWLCLAEAFQRSQNPLGGLLHLVLCLTTVGNTIPSMKGAKEIFRMCSRMARDIHILPLAMKYVQFERDVIQRYRVDTYTEYQLVQMEHIIRTIPALGQGTLYDLQALVHEGCAFLKAEHDNQPMPMLSTLAVLFSHIQEKGGKIDAEHQALFDIYMERVPSAIRALLLSQAEAKPTEDTLRTLAQRVGNANSLDDLCFQGRPLRIAAERAVAQAYLTRDIPLYLLASGILTQPTLSMALNRAVGGGLDSNTVNEWLYRYVGGATANQEQIKDIIGLAASSIEAKRVSFSSTLNLNVESAVAIFRTDETGIVLSRDGSGSLYALPVARNGAGDVRCLSPDAWNPTRYREWSKTHPYAYGMWLPVADPFVQEEPTLQDVRDSLSGLSPAVWSPDGHNIVVPDAGLFGFPFNLIPCGERFAGQLYRISCVPSLSWLSAARSAAHNREKGRAAWLGVPGKRDFTLEMLAAKTESTLDGNGFTIHQSDRPSGMSGVPLAVVAAHGGVGQWGQFVTITADRKLRFTPREFAHFFNDCGCVVLLVCSAGRSDEKQYAGETCSLVTELFEHGVQTVIAPVWPLAIDVAEIWLPEFLAQFTTGETAMNASFAAARKVETRFSNPCAWAAMHLYGDGSARH